MIKNKNNYKRLGSRGVNKITYKEWIKDWQLKVLWSEYFDIDIYDVEEPIVNYCESHDLEYEVDGCEILIVCNRKEYNDLRRIVDVVLSKRYED